MKDELKNAWLSQASPQRLTLNVELVLNEVRRNQRKFAATNFWRDVRELGVALLLLPFWIYLGISRSLPWSWYLGVPTLLWVAIFMITDRMRQRRRHPGPGETLRDSVESSLAQVEHQIWLLRNVGWWYLLPLTVPAVVFFAHTAWRSHNHGLPALEVFAWKAVVFALVGWAIYRLNQHAVRKELEPRRRELQTLQTQLDDPTSRNENFEG